MRKATHLKTFEYIPHVNEMMALYVRGLTLELGVIETK